MGYKNKVYNQFQVVGYDVPTTHHFDQPQGGLKGVKQPLPNWMGAFPEKLGCNDAYVRFQRMAWVVDTARQHQKKNFGNQLKGTLTIFVVPEFYFRPSKTGDASAFWTGKNTSAKTYSVASAHQLCKALAQMFEADEFTDWLFLFGSVVWECWPSDVVDLDINGATETPCVMSSALLVKGGKEGPCATIHKTAYSPEDGIDEAQWPYKLNKNKEFVGPLAALLGNQEIRLRRFQKLDGFTFGVEICREHSLGVLKQTRKDLLQDKQLQDRARSLHFQLLPTCGAGLKRDSVPVDEGGYVIRAEGNAGKPSVGPNVLVRNTSSFRSIPSLLQDDATDNEVAVRGTQVCQVIRQDQIGTKLHNVEPDKTKVAIPEPFCVFDAQAKQQLRLPDEQLHFFPIQRRPK